MFSPIIIPSLVFIYGWNYIGFQGHRIHYKSDYCWLNCLIKLSTIQIWGLTIIGLKRCRILICMFYKQHSILDYHTMITKFNKMGYIGKQKWEILPLTECVCVGIFCKNEWDRYRRELDNLILF